MRAGRPGRRRARLPACLLAAALLAGCSAEAPRGPAGGPVPRPAPAGAGTVGAAATTTPAAELRAGLTWLLVERSHLLATARQAVLRSGARSAPPVRAVEGLLEQGAAELAGTVGGGRAGLLQALQAEVDAVLADGGGPATSGLEEAHARLASLLRAQAPTLAAPALTRALDRSTAGLAGPVPAGDGTASAVAAGLVANALAARDGLGSTETSAVVLRADLTGLLVSRAHLAGAVPDEARLTALTETLSRRLVPGVGGPRVAAALRSGHAALHAAARRRTEGVMEPDAAARAALQAADRDLADRVAAAVPALPADLVLRELDPARGPLLAAVGARAGGDGDAAALSRASARRAVVTAAVLAAGLAEQARMS